MNDNNSEFRTGSQLLAEWGCQTREKRLERAVIALMGQLNELHKDIHGQDLEATITNESVFCSCADAYRMGHELING
jgi:hypothetical protein